MTFRYAYLFVTVIIGLLFIETASAIECNSTPTDGCTVTRDTIFNQNNYVLPHGIIINANNIVLNCNNSILNGEHNFQSGVTIFRRSNVTIKNCNIINYERSNLFVRESNDAKIENNKLENSEWNYGIHIYHSSGNVLKNNKIENNRMGLYIESSEKKNYDNSIDETNTVNSKSIVYIFDKKDLEINNIETGHIEINYGDNISIISNNVQRDGILLKNVINSIISSNNIKQTDVAIDLQSSSDNKIIGNQISESVIGIRVGESSNNLISTNKILLSGYEGFSLFDSNNNLIQKNEIISSEYYNLRLTSSSNNLILNNMISNAEDSGVLIDGVLSAGNNFSLNNFEGNKNFNLINRQKLDISAENNWWGSANISEIKKSIYERQEDRKSGGVFFRPFLTQRN